MFVMLDKIIGKTLKDTKFILVMYSVGDLYEMWIYVVVSIAAKPVPLYLRGCVFPEQ
jgi:hypothetical protein